MRVELPHVGLTHATCKHLRWEVGLDYDPMVGGQVIDVAYHCDIGMAQKGLVVDPYRCNPDRQCYEMK